MENEQPQNQPEVSPTPTSNDNKPVEQKPVSVEQRKIEKEYERKRFIIRNKEKIFKYSKLSAVVILGIAVVALVVYLLIWVVGILRPTPVQPDQNTNVIEGPPEDFTIVTDEVKVLQPVSGETNYDVLVKITNNDSDWGVSRLKYKIILKDSFDKVVGERERISYILPDQTRSLIEIGINADRAVSKSEINFELQDVMKLKDFVYPRIVVEKSAYLIADNKSIVEMTLFNNTAFTFRSVDLNVLLYKDNEVVGLNYTNINDFVTDTRRNVSARWNDVIPVEVDKVIVEPNVNVFQSSNFMNVFGAQDLNK